MIKSNTFLRGVKGINEEPAEMTNAPLNSQVHENTDFSYQKKRFELKAAEVGNSNSKNNLLKPSDQNLV